MNPVKPTYESCDTKAFHLNIWNKLKNLICNPTSIETTNSWFINIIQYRHVRDVQILSTNKKPQISSAAPVIMGKMTISKVMLPPESHYKNHISSMKQV